MLTVLLALAALAQEPATDGIRRPAPPESRAVVEVPDFELEDVHGEPFRLSRDGGGDWVLLVFVRGMW